MNTFKKIMLMSAGFVLVVLGAIGMFVPVMPSLPFLIIASVCFSKSSQKFHHMLLDNKLVGRHIKKYHEDNGLTLKAKLLIIAAQWAGIGLTSVFLVHNLLGRILMLVIGLSVTAYTISLKTVKP